MSANDELTEGTNPNFLKPGQKVGGGNFTLIKMLGRGGMGVVWLARDESLNEDVALKFLPPEVAADAIALDDLRRETRKSRRLTHPQIMRIHAFHGAPGEPAFISMEFVDGPNLTSLRLQQQQRCFTWKFLEPLMRQLCGALDYAHGEKIIHRDLKPSNLMLDARGRLKLADFGIAATMSDSMNRVSLQSATSGTLVYMSPQQLRGETPRATDDIYALGATFYELLTSKPPFFRGDIADQVKHEPPQPLAERLHDFEITNPIPEHVKELIMSCLAKEAAQRPQSTQEILQRLDAPAVAAAKATSAPVLVAQTALEISPTISGPPPTRGTEKPSQTTSVPVTAQLPAVASNATPPATVSASPPEHSASPSASLPPVAELPPEKPRAPTAAPEMSPSPKATAPAATIERDAPIAAQSSKSAFRLNIIGLFAPGAFLWLTFQQQSLYGAPMAGGSMWCGLLVAATLCFAMALTYSELFKLYPSAGSSYAFAGQLLLARSDRQKSARFAKFLTYWASHLCYWVYPGLMVGVTAILAGYLAAQFWPDTFSGIYNSPLFMWLFCVVFALVLGSVACRGVNCNALVSLAIITFQIVALVVFSIMAIAYRTSHRDGSVGWQLSNNMPVNYNVAQATRFDANNKPVQATWANGDLMVDDKKQPVWNTLDRMVTADDLDKARNTNAVELASLTALGVGVGDPYPAWKVDDKTNAIVKDGIETPDPFILSFKLWDSVGGSGTVQDPKTFNYHVNAASVVTPHGFGALMLQMCVAILLFVGFESVTVTGAEAGNPQTTIGRAVLLFLAVLGAFCFLFEYFAANYFLNSGYTLSYAGTSGAPLGDMLVLIGTSAFGSYSAGRTFMLIEAASVFIALIGATLSSLNAGARVTEVTDPGQNVTAQSKLPGKNLSSRSSIWALVALSIIIGILTTLIYLGGQSYDLLPLDMHNVWYTSIPVFSPHAYTFLPNTLLVVTLIVNFGAFLLYLTTCFIALKAFKGHPAFSSFKHFVIPLFGLLTSLICMIFYLIGPFTVKGMSWHEPYIALAVAVVWSIFALIYFKSSNPPNQGEI